VREGVEREERYCGISKVEVERTTSKTASWQNCSYDATDWIQKLARHKHQHDDDQCFGHVVLGLRFLGHVLTTFDSSKMALIH